MTRLQERFCEEYLIDADAKAAAIRAGYSAKSSAAAWKLMRNKEIRQRICDMAGEETNERGSRANDVVAFLTAVMRGEIKEFKASAKDRLHAAELLGKRYGAFDTKDGGRGRTVIVISGEKDLE